MDEIHQSRNTEATIYYCIALLLKILFQGGHPLFVGRQKFYILIKPVYLGSAQTLFLSLSVSQSNLLRQTVTKVELGSAPRFLPHPHPPSSLLFIFISYSTIISSFSWSMLFDATVMVYGCKL